MKCQILFSGKTIKYIVNLSSAVLAKRVVKVKSCLKCADYEEKVSGFTCALRKHAYSNILKILPPKNENFQIKILIFFNFCSKHRLWALVRPQSMFLSRNKKNNVYPCKPQFYYIKVGFKRVRIILACFRDAFIPASFAVNYRITLFFSLHMSRFICKI